MMMGVVKKMIAGKPASQLTDSEHELLAAIQEGADYTDRTAIIPLVQEIQSV